MCMEKYAPNIRKAGGFNTVYGLPEIIHPWAWHGEYHLLSHSNALPAALIKSMDSLYARYTLDAEIWITNTPSSLLRRIYPQALILHYEFGMFSRSPFPEIHQLDPWGYSHKSLLAKYPSLHLPTTPAHLENIDRLKNKVIRQSQLDKELVGKTPAVHIPLQSESNWPTRLESQLTRKAMIEQFIRLNPDQALIVTEKSGHGLADADRESILSGGQVRMIQDGAGLSSGSFQTAYCQTTYSASPSLTLQTIFWGNRLITPANSSMSLWSAYDLSQAQNILASYIGNFSVCEPQDLSRVIENGWTVRESRPAL